MPQLQVDKVGEEKAQEQALRQSIKNRLANSLASLPEQPAPKSPTAEQDDVKKLGQEICGVLQSAWKKTGSLDLLRQEQDEVVQAAPEDEMETVRTNLNSLMKDALLTGQLATALEELKTKSEEPLRITDIHAIKAKLKKLLREALDKGILASKVFKLKLIPKAPPPPTESPPDEMDVLKLRLREALQHAAEGGRLAEALAWLRSGPAEGVQETMQELQKKLSEAALSGTLAETLRSLRQDVMLQAMFYIPEALYISLYEAFQALDREASRLRDERERDMQSAKAQLKKAQIENKAIEKQLSDVRKKLQKTRDKAEEHDKASAHAILELAEQQWRAEEMIEQLLEEVDDGQEQRQKMQREFFAHREDLVWIVQRLWQELHPPKVGSEGDDNR